jgi:hypothetical protein
MGEIHIFFTGYAFIQINSSVSQLYHFRENSYYTASAYETWLSADQIFQLCILFWSLVSRMWHFSHCDLFGCLFIYDSTGDWTRGLVLAKQVLCLLNHTSRPLILIWMIVSSEEWERKSKKYLSSKDKTFLWFSPIQKSLLAWESYLNTCFS